MRKLNAKHRLYFFLIVLCVAYPLHLFFAFANVTKTKYAPKPASLPVDAIVVLTGGQNRASEGLRLLRQGAGGVLVLSGVNTDADADSIFQNKINENERLKIILEKNSSSTYSNAVEVRKLVEKNKFRSIILLTSDYHMKRADFIFRRIMPPGLRIVNRAVSGPNYDSRKWWKGNGPALAIPEFLKYYWYKARFALGG